MQSRLCMFFVTVTSRASSCVFASGGGGGNKDDIAVVSKFLHTFNPFIPSYYREKVRFHHSTKNVVQNIYLERTYTVKKVNNFPVSSGDVTNQTLPGRE